MTAYKKELTDEAAPLIWNRQQKEKLTVSPTDNSPESIFRLGYLTGAKHALTSSDLLEAQGLIPEPKWKKPEEEWPEDRHGGVSDDVYVTMNDGRVEEAVATSVWNIKNDVNEGYRLLYPDERVIAWQYRYVPKTYIKQ